MIVGSLNIAKIVLVNLLWLLIAEGAHKCEQNHKCYTKCRPCPVEVERKLNRCSHTSKMACHEDPNNFQCKWPCERKLNCYHNCQNLCFQDCGPCTVKNLNIYSTFNYYKSN